MKKIAGIIGLIALLAATNAAEAQKFTLEFEWGNIPLCDSGSPNTVDNPIFRLGNVPTGTKFINFALTDLDAPNYNHGGGTVPYSGQKVIKPGAFKYESPCPPSGSHTYEWDATAKDGDGFFSGTLGSTKASVSYP
jgi:phosphatidylethanolamine-binding protein (PEBP) family uncharacterized protein